MTAIQFLPVATATAEFIDLPDPVASGHDLLVKVEAVGLNPVDTKVRPDQDDTAPRVLGYDAAGTVAALGEEVRGFAVGDPVYYAGDITRPGTNSSLHLVDARIVGKRPQSLNAAASAALPLTSLTAWEALFDRLGVSAEGADRGRSLLVIGGAGGVGSIAIQLAKWAGLTVIATASREESAAWCRKLGADHVVNHRESLGPQLAQLGFETVEFIANFHSTEAYWQQMGELIAPQGKLVLIVEPAAPLAAGDPFKRKSATIAWEFMFTRSMFRAADIARQGEILDRVASLVDDGVLRTTAATVLSPIDPTNLEDAHRRIESGSTIGKVVVEGW